MDAAGIDDTLSKVRAAIDQSEYETASAAIQALDVQSLASEHRGRVLALTIVLACRRVVTVADEGGVRGLLDEALTEHKDDPSCLTAAGIELSDAALHGQVLQEGGKV